MYQFQPTPRINTYFNVFLQIFLSSCRFLQIHADSCRFLQILSSSCRFLKISLDSCRFFPILAQVTNCQGAVEVKDVANILKVGYLPQLLVLWDAQGDPRTCLTQLLLHKSFSLSKFNFLINPIWGVLCYCSAAAVFSSILPLKIPTLLFNVIQSNRILLSII